MKPGKCSDRIDRMKAVQREYRVATVARDALIEALGKDPSTLTTRGLENADFAMLRNNLDATYLIRLFAEFETGLKDYWKHGLKKNPGARVFIMIDSVSSKRNVKDYDRTNAHNVRRYRNRLVHEEDSEAEAVSIGVARGFLCKFFAKLPEDW